LLTTYLSIEIRFESNVIVCHVPQQAAQQCNPYKTHLFQQSHIGYLALGVTIEHYIKINLDSSRLT
jgi:hypothetical protein